MDDLRQFIETVAPTDSTVLILGESGTGKELVAGAIHYLSSRKQQNYIRQYLKVRNQRILLKV